MTPDTHRRYHDPAAPRGFAADSVGFTDPMVEAFIRGDARSGVVEVRPVADGPATTVIVRQLRESEGVAAQVLDSLGIRLEAARDMVAETVASVPGPMTGSPAFTPRAKKVMELSLREALTLGHAYIDTEHLLLGVVREVEGMGAKVLISMGADLDRIHQAVMQLLTERGEVRQVLGANMVLPTPGGPMNNRLVASSTKRRVASSAISLGSTVGWAE